MRSAGKPSNLNFPKKDLGQFVERVSYDNNSFLAKEETKIYDKQSNMNNTMTNGGGDNSTVNRMNKSEYSAISPDCQNWFELRINGRQPRRRAYHSCFIFSKKQAQSEKEPLQLQNRMFIFGGHDIKEGSLDTLWMIDISKLAEQNSSEFPEAYDKKIQWQKLETTGKEKPGKSHYNNYFKGQLSHHTTVVFGEKMYTFGGSNQSMRDNQHSFFALDLKTLRWEVMHGRGDVPTTRDDHSAIIYEGSMVIFGGFSSDGERTNDVYRYYFKDNKWEKVSALGLDSPCSRAGHSALVFGDSMVVFGGKDSEGNKLNDLWVFNFSTYQWEKIEISDNEQKPLHRSGHSACLYKDMMLIFGGIYEVTRELDDMLLFDFRNKRWITFFDELNSPSRLKQQNSQNSPEASPSSKFSQPYKQNESFKFEQQRPMTTGGVSAGNYNSISSPNRMNQSRFSINKGKSSYAYGSNMMTNENQSKSLIRQSTMNRSRPGTSASATRKRNRPSLHNADKHKESATVQLESPTSVSMKNSFIIKNADPSFEHYYNSMRKKRTNAANTAASILNSSLLTQPAEGPYGKVQGKRPSPRDGHSCVIYGDYCLVFGGDRHHMPFNDIYMLDLRKEFIMRSHIFH